MVTILGISNNWRFDFIGFLILTACAIPVNNTTNGELISVFPGHHVIAIKNQRDIMPHLKQEIHSFLHPSPQILN